MLIAPDVLAAEPLLSTDDEIVLAREIEAGVLAREARLLGRTVHDATEVELRLIEERGERGRQRFIRANLRLVAKIAGQTAARSQLPEGDLFQEGCLGLICAVERFDWRRGYKFSTYASFWIRAYVGEAAAHRFGALNVPASRANQLRFVRAVELELVQTLGRSVSLAEVAAASGRTVKWTRDLLAQEAPQAFDALDIDTLEVAERGRVEMAASDDDAGGELLWQLQGLQREVLALRYGFTDGTAHTYAEIGRRLTINVSRVRRLEGRALEALRSICPNSASLQL
jgi:RNA polymerase sigma factor (sigma-70 family)